MRRLYLDAPDPAIHTCMVVARAREQTTPTALEAPTGAAATPTATATATAPALKPARSEGARVIGTGGDSKFAKVGMKVTGVQSGHTEEEATAQSSLRFSGVGEHCHESLHKNIKVLR